MASFSEAAANVHRWLISPQEIIAINDTILGGGDKWVAASIIAHFEEVYALPKDVPSDRLQPLLDEKKRLFETMLKGIAIAPRPGVREMLELLKAHGYIPALATNTPGPDTDRYLTDCGLVHLFPKRNIVIASDLPGKPMKPDPTVYIETARRMRVARRRQVVFEDSRTGLEAARRAGSQRIATPIYSLPHVMEAVMAEKPLRVIWDWRDVNIIELLDEVQEELAQRR